MLQERSPSYCTEMMDVNQTLGVPVGSARIAALSATLKTIHRPFLPLAQDIGIKGTGRFILKNFEGG